MLQLKHNRIKHILKLIWSAKRRHFQFIYYVFVPYNISKVWVRKIIGNSIGYSYEWRNLASFYWWIELRWHCVIKIWFSSTKDYFKKSPSLPGYSCFKVNKYVKQFLFKNIYIYFERKIFWCKITKNFDLRTHMILTLSLSLTLSDWQSSIFVELFILGYIFIRILNWLHSTCVCKFVNSGI